MRTEELLNFYNSCLPFIADNIKNDASLIKEVYDILGKHDLYTNKKHQDIHQTTIIKREEK